MLQKKDISSTPIRQGLMGPVVNLTRHSLYVNPYIFKYFRLILCVFFEISLKLSFVCMSSVCLCVYLVSVCMYVKCMFVCISSVCMYVCQVSVYMYVQFLFVWVSGVCLYVCLVSVCMYVWFLFVCMSGVCLSISDILCQYLSLQSCKLNYIQ